MTISFFQSTLKQNYMYYILLMYAFFLPTSRAAISIITALFIVIFLLNKNLKENLRIILKNKVIQALFFFLAYMAVSLFWSSDIDQGVKLLFRYWYLLPMIIFITHAKKKYIPKIISAFLAGMLISEILSYGIFFELWTFGHGTPSDPTPFMNHLQYSMFLAFTSLLLLNRFFFEDKWKWKTFYFFYFLLVASNLLINGGRTGQLAFVLSIFVVGFLNIKNKLLAIFSMVVLASAIFFTAYNASPVFKTRFDQAAYESKIITANSENKYQGSFGQRLGSWVGGIEIFKEKPIFGVGHGASMKELKLLIDNGMDEIDAVYDMLSFHNNYMNYLVEGGVIGLFLYLFLLYQILKLSIPNKEYKNLSYIFLSVYSISSVFEQMFIAQFPLALFALFSGIFLVLSKQTPDLGTSK